MKERVEDEGASPGSDEAVDDTRITALDAIVVPCVIGFVYDSATDMSPQMVDTDFLLKFRR